MAGYIYNEKGFPVGFYISGYVYRLDGTPIGVFRDTHVHKLSGDYVGELDRDMVVDKALSLGKLQNPAKPFPAGKLRPPGRRTPIKLPYPDAFHRLVGE